MSKALKILLVGGAGYIGSHMVWLLGQKGAEVVTIDNLSGGYRDAVLCGEFVEGDIADSALLDQLFSEHKFDAVMHFASFIQVGESVKDPAKYYQNNVVNTLNLLNAMIKHGVKRFIFSSTAAIFGEPKYIPIDERHPKQPINPYGRTKLMIEQILEDYDQAYNLKSVCLRYFNAAGAHPEGILGERHDPETHLMPLALQAAQGISEFTLYGDDFDTVDGTCVRDYVHVMDLCTAHYLALKHLMDRGDSRQYNLGNGVGYSVMEVITATELVTHLSVPLKRSHRRAGDPASLVADASLIARELGWKPKYNQLSQIILHAFLWTKDATTSLNQSK